MSRARGDQAHSGKSGVRRNSWELATSSSRHRALAIAAPEGGDEPVAQGVSPGDHRWQRHKPPDGGGSTVRTGNPASRVIRPASGAGRSYPSVFPGLTPWATSVSPPPGAEDEGSAALRNRLPTNNEDSHPSQVSFDPSTSLLWTRSEQAGEARDAGPGFRGAASCRGVSLSVWLLEDILDR
jgi:hypothetical protein